EQEDVPEKMRFNLGPLASRLGIMIRINNTRNTIFQFLEEDPLKFSRENRGYLSAHFNERLDGALRLLMHGSRPDNDGLKRVKSYEKHLKQLGERSFSSLTPREVEEMRDVIEQLVRKLKDIVGLRYATMNKGGLDVKKTLRRAAKYQGNPIEIKYRNRPPGKAKIVTLCDVSSSVWSAARFMLNILYSLQECFTKVRSFVFVSGLADVSETFENYEINKAIEKVLKDVDIEYHAATDYGETFRHFRAEYMDALNKKTTLIIIGDGRSNYFNPEEAILEEMRDKCRRIIWLNPDPENVWYTGDSEMRTYETYCHELRPCRNLNQLIDFIEDLIL
ncbi:MAG: VWA domain-containing protein, partial [Thermodesulfobacteriota bacterium]|nr:VWA domain-containing protein [Thermodesulfobacteriota bacterium]